MEIQETVDDGDEEVANIVRPFGLLKQEPEPPKRLAWGSFLRGVLVGALIVAIVAALVLRSILEKQPFGWWR